FSRPTRNGVLYAEAGKDFQRAVVHGHGDVHNDFTLRIAQDLPQSFIKVKFLCGEIEAGCLRLPGIQLLLKRYCFHLCSKGILKRKRAYLYFKHTWGTQLPPCSTI